MYNKRVKELTEKRGTALSEARALVELSEKEDRDLTGEELQKLEKYNEEAEYCVRALQAESRLIAEEGRQVDFSTQEEEDIRSFSIAKFLRQLDPNNKGETLDGIELEMVQEGMREARANGMNPQGQMLSRKAFTRFEKRDMTATGGTSLNQGGMTIATEKGNLLDDLFNNLVLRQAGATYLPDLTGNLDIPRLVKGTAPAGKAENAQATEYTATTAMLSLSPNRLPTVIEVSNQLLKQSDSVVEPVIRRHLEAFLMQQMQVKLLHGSGTAEPTGLASTSGIGSVVGGTNGAAPDYADMVNLQREVNVDDAGFGNLAYLINAKVEAKLKTVAQITNAINVIDSRTPGTIDAKPYFMTNSVSSGLTKGSSSGVCSAIFYGNWADLWIGQWGGIEFLINPYSKDDYGLTRINAAVYYDGGAVRPVSFSAMLDALTA